MLSSAQQEIADLTGKVERLRARDAHYWFALMLGAVCERALVAMKNVLESRP